MPTGLVRMIASPGRAPEFVTMASGRMAPVTAKPNLISSSLMLCPPTRMTPASRSLSMPPWSMRTSHSSLSVWIGQPTIESAVSGAPPIA